MFLTEPMCFQPAATIVCAYCHSVLVLSTVFSFRFSFWLFVDSLIYPFPMEFEKIGLKAPIFLLPEEGVDPRKWAVVACDQFTSEVEYWDDVAAEVGEAPSTLNLIFPEVFLDGPDEADRIKHINAMMKKYIQDGVLRKVGPAFVLVDRKTSQKESRKGLVVALDLECYDYSVGSQTLVRATEGTIVERLPPRMKIREGAPIELPHIMVLIDDPEKTIIEPLFEKELPVLYDFDLMKDSGHLRGCLVDDPEDLKRVAAGIEKLAEREVFEKRYGAKDKGTLLYAMGDGNHSLATAKAIWERLKKDGAPMDHPSRFALVELVNVHDEGLEFEPIHRLIFNIDTDAFMEDLRNAFKELGSEVTIVAKSEGERKSTPTEHVIEFVHQKMDGYVVIHNPRKNLEVGTLQEFLDPYMRSNKTAKIDYVHGNEVVMKKGKMEKNIGFFLPPMSKHDLFKTVIVDGALPRKTFSMGEADEKRFYFECRRIIP
eukprot:TRINITY_DN82214_c0_g1_i1.p1 TRINITY_DN82214_c0_g1~~TRINITY_DN82214_c0_g1_i1.p1  ORF type:complete len:485 (-),score=153.63 TRINITY_DN82214_c0_g1_i1:118-1572(-)